ncbi:MAG: hypothetical protein IPK26_13890 [Planctomycetes bacterium]|nr:hypothetical protein [Planctomycetota bacterium]
MTKQTILGVATLAATLLFAASAVAQGPSQDQLKANKAEKLKKEFATAAPWITDYDKAREEAKKSDRLIFAYFTRSYAP